VSTYDGAPVRPSPSGPPQRGVSGSARVPAPGVRGPSGRGTSGGGRGGNPPGEPANGKPGRGKSGPGKPGKPRDNGIKRRKPIGSILTIFLGVVIMLASVGIYVSVVQVIAKVNTAVPAANLLGTSKKAEAGSSINGVLNILLIGVDTRPNNTIGSRSDSIIIAHIPASHKAAYLVSIPRDTVVPIPGHGTTKINAAFEFGSAHNGGYSGGAQLLVKTLGADYGLTFDSVVIVNFDGFTSIVNALGGVTMYVDEKTTSLHHGYKIVNGKKVEAAPFSTKNNGLTWHKVPGVTPVVYQVGTQHLTPYEALDYVRIRDFLPNGDYDRERHQQQFIKAVLQEAVTQGIDDPTKIASFLTSISKAFVWDRGNFSTGDWIFTLKGISPANLLTIKTNNGTFNTKVVNGQDEEVLDPTSLQLLQAVKNDTLGAFIQLHPTWVSSS
jgi:polyisoprenyl-teichoic acid--peptidoglycan teichoic acid transferase